MALRLRHCHTTAYRLAQHDPARTARQQTPHARSLATMPNLTPEEATEALAMAKQAAELTANKNIAILDTLAAAWATSGDFTNAISTIESALTLTPATDQNTVDLLRSRLDLYNQGKRLITPK